MIYFRPSRGSRDVYWERARDKRLEWFLGSRSWRSHDLSWTSWLGGYDPDFAGYFKEAWDGYLHRHRDLIVVLCGSVSAWIAENILNSTGFVGRDSFDIELNELSLADGVKFFGAMSGRLFFRRRLIFKMRASGIRDVRSFPRTNCFEYQPGGDASAERPEAEKAVSVRS